MPRGVRRFPAMLESERAVIGYMLRGEGATWAAELQEEDFHDTECQKAFVAIKGLVDEGLDVSALPVHERSGLPMPTVASLKEAGASLGEHQVQTTVTELQRVSGLRSAHRACEDAIARVNKDARLEDVLGPLEATMYRADRAGSSEALDGSDVMANVALRLIDRVKNGSGTEVSTGIKALDRAIIGLRPGKVMVIAGRPGMGKTALSSSIRRGVLAQGYGVVEFNLEMSAEEIAERELAFQAGVNLRKILAAKEVSDDELQRIGSVAGTDLSGRWFIDDRTSSIGGIRRRARIVGGRMARSGVKMGLVILDYIQLAGDHGDGREQSVAAISRGCKLLAKELGCTVLALSQLNRACENRDDRRPILSDLRESGAIEQDADIVAFVYRESVYNPEHPEDDAELLIRKHRAGPTGTVRLRFDAKVTSFGDPTPTSRPAGGDGPALLSGPVVIIQ
jgi:replicative DNA helicase